MRRVQTLAGVKESSSGDKSKQEERQQEEIPGYPWAQGISARPAECMGNVMGLCWPHLPGSLQSRSSIRHMRGSCCITRAMGIPRLAP